MEKISYKNQTNTSVEVYLDNQRTGTIKKVDGGWQYTPKGSKDGGDVYPSLDKCKESLEEE